MSSMQAIEVACPSCDTKIQMTLWNSLNVDLNPEARQELLDGKINTAHCSQCGSQGFLPAPFMYHDMSRRFVVQFVPFDSLDDDNFLGMFDTAGNSKLVAAVGETILQSKDPTERPQMEAAVGYMDRIHTVFDMEELVRYVQFRERLFARDQ